MNVAAIHAFLVLLSAAHPSPTPEKDVRRFVLRITVERTDVRKLNHAEDSPAAVSESELILFGRVRCPREGNTVTFYADSIRYEARRPLAFQTFMSADTMYYRSSGGGGAVDHREAAYDSMLSCVFGGAALSVDLGGAGAPQVAHLNDRCECGLYERINAPITLTAFLISPPDGRDHWHELRTSASFSGVGFYPAVEWLYRVVRTTKRDASVTVAADSTIENYATRMKNGEEVMILRDRIRVGGTVVIDRSTGLATFGEIRVGESLHLSRPTDRGVLAREGRYTIHFSLP